MGSQFKPVQNKQVSKNHEALLSALCGSQPCNRDDIFLAFGPKASGIKNGQVLAGTGALVFEGEVLELPRWH